MGFSLALSAASQVRGREILKDWMIVVDILVVICGYAPGPATRESTSEFPIRRVP